MKQTNIVSTRLQAKASPWGGAFQLDGKKRKEPYLGPRNASTVVLGRRYFKSCPASAANCLNSCQQKREIASATVFSTPGT